MNMKFKCPSCGGNRLECCMNGPHACPITEIDEEGDFEYGEYDSFSEPDRFQCLECGFVLKHKTAEEGFNDYIITESRDIVEWCKKNCKQN